MDCCRGRSEFAHSKRLISIAPILHKLSFSLTKCQLCICLCEDQTVLFAPHEVDSDDDGD